MLEKLSRSNSAVKIKIHRQRFVLSPSSRNFLNTLLPNIPTSYQADLVDSIFHLNPSHNGLKDRRLDYFQLLGHPCCFRLDDERLQRALHPENFGWSSETEHCYSEEQSALVNEAYAVLLKPVSRGLYLLGLELARERVPSRPRLPGRRVGSQRVAVGG